MPFQLVRANPFENAFFIRVSYDSLRGARGAGHWQLRFYDFNVYSHKKKKEKLEYMHANPVVRGLVRHPKDWPWSSFSFYAKNEAGLAGIDAVDL